MDALIQDIRFAVRQVVKSPGFTLVAVLTLAIGIGATTAVYGLANWVLLRPIPGAVDDGRLVSVSVGTNRGIEAAVAYPDYREYARRIPAFSGLAAQEPGRSMPLVVPFGAPRSLRADLVSANYFDVLGVRPLLGRAIDSADLARGALPVAAISERVWREMLSSDGNVIGKTIQLGGMSRAVVGIMPGAFTGTDRTMVTDAWVPITVHGPQGVPGVDTYAVYFEGRTQPFIPEMFGRLAPGATREQAATQIRSVADQLMRESPADTYMLRGVKPEVRPGVGVPVERRTLILGVLRTLSWVAGILVLLAIANVTNMLLFKGVRRRGEVALRRALGASDSRIGRQFVLEALLLAVAAGFMAFGIADRLTVLFRGLQIPGSRLRLDQIQLDYRVLLFGLGLAAVVGIAIGVVPLLLGGQSRVGSALKDGWSGGGRGQAYTRGAIAVAQLGAGLTLLISALLLVGTVRNLRLQDIGFEPRGLHTFTFDAKAGGYNKGRAATLRDELVLAIGGLPGIDGVTPTYVGPLGGFGGTLPICRESPCRIGTEQLYTRNAYVTPNYFAVLGTPFVKGKAISAINPSMNSAAENEIVISESVARWVFGSAEPVGGVVYMGNWSNMGVANALLNRMPEELPDYQLRVVGVVPDSRWSSIVGHEIAPMMYRPYDRKGANTPSALDGLTLLVRSPLPFGQVRDAVQAIARTIAPSVPVTSESMLDRMDATITEQRLYAKVVALLTALAVILAAVGLYTLVAFSVAERTREFGIRMALGAQATEILDLVVGQGAVLAAAGVALGLVGAAALSRVLANRLFGVRPLEPQVYVLSIALLLLLALVASLVPARAATKVDPIVALKAD